MRPAPNTRRLGGFINRNRTNLKPSQAQLFTAPASPHGFSILSQRHPKHDPTAATDPRQDDYDIWLGTVTLDKWIRWNRHGLSNVLYLEGHAKSAPNPEAMCSS
ncbi:MAG: hypothetical protein ACLQIB_04670 [Isosphaeraceae bacterium]